jgi:hypothetical protein
MFLRDTACAVVLPREALPTITTMDNAVIAKTLKPDAVPQHRQRLLHSSQARAVGPRSSAWASRRIVD